MFVMVFHPDLCTRPRLFTPPGNAPTLKPAVHHSAVISIHAASWKIHTNTHKGSVAEAVFNSEIGGDQYAAHTWICHNVPQMNSDRGLEVDDMLVLSLKSEHFQDLLRGNPTPTNKSG